MTAMLSGAERTKLVKLLELLTRTDFNGERDAASLAARRLLDSHQISWAEVLIPPSVERSVPQVVGWRQTCAEILQHRGILTSWETTFVEGLSRFPRLSAKQQAVLDRIAGRVLGNRRN